MTAAPPSQPALLKPSRDTATPQTLTGTLTGIWMSLPLASERLAMPVTLPTFGALSARAVPPIRATAAAVAAGTPATRVRNRLIRGDRGEQACPFGPIFMPNGRGG